MISSVLWNLLLISAGSVVFGIGLKSIAIPHGFITGGLSGLTLLFYYVSGLLSPGLWYLLVNIPIFLIGWMHVSRRFFLYSMYGMAALSIAIDRVDLNEKIAKTIQQRLNRGVTYLNGSGAYTGRDKKIILTVIHNYQQKRVEEAALSIDPEAFIITENTFNVMGQGFSKRKVY